MTMLILQITHNMFHVASISHNGQLATRTRVFKNSHVTLLCIWYLLIMQNFDHVKQILSATIKTIKVLLTGQGLTFRSFSKLLISISYCKNFS